MTFFILLSFSSFILLNSNLIEKNSLQSSIKNFLEENIKFLNAHLKSNSQDKVIKNSKSNCFEIIFLLIIIFLISFFMYGVLPGLQSYSTLSYSHTAFNLSINLGNLMLPIAVFLSIWSYKASSTQIFLEFILGLFFTIYILITSWFSPCPPLVNHWMGTPIIVSCWVFAECIFIRLRCVIAAKLELYGEKTLFTLGIVTLIGQMVGGLLVYILVDIYRIFKQRPDCIFDFSYCNL